MLTVVGILVLGGEVQIFGTERFDTDESLVASGPGREIDETALRATGIAGTRQLAKRQFTWLRATAAVALDAESPDLLNDVTKLMVKHGVAMH